MAAAPQAGNGDCCGYVVVENLLPEGRTWRGSRAGFIVYVAQEVWQRSSIRVWYRFSTKVDLRWPLRTPNHE